ncbi:uncharacterized protein LOC117560559 [Gymnodraco acuticeps]|uniref:Uncharacterized protein LOC117560559 n=1 Tax=Gymnodraco acuticeps TaxID=8218 RepID=A0A6P8VR91_GYMAC|nr:uncharacterized protein LOC117560559 [Gymnodraco acuticeps]
MLGTLKESAKTHWKDFVKPLVHAYNCTKNDVTGFSPYELMFGRQPRLPIDLAFGLPLTNKQHTSHSQYVQDLKSHLEESYKIATGNAENIMQENKIRFDKHIIAADLSVGDRVLVRNVCLKGKHKLSDKWESEVYVVTKRAGTLPVYTVRPEKKYSPQRTLHRDLLLPCGYLSAPEIPLPTQIRKPITRSNTEHLKNHVDIDEDETPIYWYSELPISELSRFTTILDIPADPISSPSSTILPTTNSTAPVGAAAEDAAQNLSELKRTGKEPAEIAKEEQADIAEEERARSSEDDDLPISTSDNVDELPIRSTRNRKPPERLRYAKLGQPVLDTFHTHFHGLATAFTYALTDTEIPLHTLQQPISTQPGPCPRRT